jgi:hypothetical protein
MWDSSKTPLLGELPFLAEIAWPGWGAYAPSSIYGAGVPAAGWRVRRRDPKHHFAPVIDYRHNIVEHMAYVEEKGNHSSQKFPRKPEFPR